MMRSLILALACISLTATAAPEKDPFARERAPCAGAHDAQAHRRYAVRNLYLSPDKYWRVDSTFLVADDTPHVGMPVDRPFRRKDGQASVVFTLRPPAADR